MNNIVTSDISQFGFREKDMAAELLKTHGSSSDHTKFLGNSVNVFMNMNSGYVFLSDEDYNTAMMNGDNLEDFFSCPNCGNEESSSDFRAAFDNECCQEYANDLGLELE